MSRTPSRRPPAAGSRPAGPATSPEADSATGPGARGGPGAPTAPAAAAYAIDGRPSPDTAFYALACDPSRSVVVEACAGAGKTWMLVSRILRALLDGAEPQEILAITFTKKAAGEMRERLAEWLAGFAAAVPAERIEALVQRGMTPAQAVAAEAALGALHERVLAGGRAVAVRTFHGWFTQLMKAAPLALLGELGLHAGMDLVEDTGPYRGAAWRRFLRAVQADAALQADFDTQVRHRGRNALEGWRDQVLEKSVEIELADRAGVLARSVPDARAAWPSFDPQGAAEGGDPLALLHREPLRPRLFELCTALAAGKLAKAREAAANLEQALSIEDPQACFDAAWFALVTKQGAPRKLGDVPGLADALEALQAIRTALDQQAAHLEHLRLVRLARVLLNEWRALKRERGVADMPDLERIAMHLLRDAPLAAWVHERLDTRVRHLLIDEFQDTSPLQWQALQAWLAGYAGAGGGASGRRPPSVFIVGDPKQSIYRFRRAEPRVFQAAKAFVREGLDGAVLSCDHTRRNAPEVIAAVNATFGPLGAEFDGFRAHTTAAVASPRPPAVCVLPQTLRPPSAAAATAQAVTADGASEAALKPGAGHPPPEGRAAAAGDGPPDPSERTAWRDSLNTPRVEAEEALRAQEARHVAAAIADQVARGLAPGRIMVLARQRSRLQTVAEALRERRLPCVEPQATDLADTPEGADLIALLDALASPTHDLSLARALRSPLFEARDEDLMALALAVRARRAQGLRVAWWDLLCDPAASPPPVQGRAAPALQRAHALLPLWREAAQRLPPHDLLQQVFAQGEVRERYAAVVPAAARALALERLDGLLHGALSLDQGRYASVYGFVRALRQRGLPMAPLPHGEAVQLLTVHGAKGLEADVVFLVDTDAARPQHGGLEVLVQWPVEAEAPQCCAFVKGDGGAVPSLAGLRQQEAAAQAREELNGLYVAMTRARERLVFSRTEPHQARGGPSWWALVQAAEPEAWDPLGDEAAARHASPKSDGGLPASDAVWLPVLSGGPAGPGLGGPGDAGVGLGAEAYAGQGDASGQQAGAALAPAAADLGRVVHRMLEWLTRQPVARRDAQAVRAAARAAIAQLGAGHALGDTAAAADAAFAITTRMLDSPATAPWLDPACSEWADNEVSLAWQGEVLRLDRLVARREGGTRTWWVLDYKLNQAPEALPGYRAQMQRYVAAVQALQPGEPVRAAFITGAGDWIECV